MSEPWISNCRPLIEDHSAESSVNGDAEEEIIATTGSFMEQYGSIYNKNGRIGIYTKEVSCNLHLYMNLT